MFKTPFNAKVSDVSNYIVLTAILTFKSTITGKTYIVPEGYHSNGASIPRIPLLWFIFSHPFDKDFLKEAVLHDYLIKEKVEDRRLADKIFKEALYLHLKEYKGLKKHGHHLKYLFMYLGVSLRTVILKRRLS